VPYLWGTNGIGYNVDKVKQVLGIDHIDSWAVLFEPENIKKLNQCGVAFLDSADELFPAILNYMGKDPRSENPEDYKQAEAKLLTLRPYITYFHSSKYISDLANGDICVAIGYSGDVLQAKSRAEESKKEFHIKYNIPKEGAVMFFDNMAIPADAGHVKNAHLFIDYMLRPEVAARNSNFISYANSNAASWPLVNADVKNNPGIFPTPDVMPKLVPDLPESPEFTRALTRTWTKFRTGK
jgi:putative spermidine/putrescine transport system substrate-binding protein/putrescine transport system substrate-binding protein